MLCKLPGRSARNMMGERTCGIEPGRRARGPATRSATCFVPEVISRHGRWRKTYKSNAVVRLPPRGRTYG